MAYVQLQTFYMLEYLPVFNNDHCIVLKSVERLGAGPLPLQGMEARLSLRQQAMLFYVKAKFDPEGNHVPAAHQLSVDQSW